jgi:hypothetical protein
MSRSLLPLNLKRRLRPQLPMQRRLPLNRKFRSLLQRNLPLRRSKYYLHGIPTLLSGDFLLLSFWKLLEAEWL